MLITEIIGTGPHLSPLLRKAKHLGFYSANDLLFLAIKRGCRHYQPPGWRDESVNDPGPCAFKDEELAIALITPAAKGGPQHIRCAAQLMSRPGLDAKRLVRLSRMERCEPILRHIAEAGLANDPDGDDFWDAILRQLPDTPTIPKARLPHPSRFMIVPGWSPSSRPQRPAYWLRPR